MSQRWGRGLLLASGILLHFLQHSVGGLARLDHYHNKDTQRRPLSSAKAILYKAYKNPRL
jgi:hypothetical protein